MGGRSTEKKNRPFAYSEGLTIPIPEDLLKSEAFRVLTNFEKLLLFDAIRVYCRATNWGKRPLPEGFIYTHGMCLLDVSDKRFYQARKRLCQAGFFAAPPEIQEMTPNPRTRYVASTDWKKYEPTAAERAKLRERDNTRRHRHERGKKRRADFLARLPDPKTETGGRKDVDLVQAKRRGPRKEGNETYRRKDVDLRRKNANTHRTKGRGSNIAIPLRPDDAAWVVFYLATRPAKLGLLS